MPIIRVMELHPMLMHFPIALRMVGILLDFLALFKCRARVVAAASLCLGFAALGLLAAELSWQLIEEHVKRALAGHLLEVHQAFALATGMTFVTLFAQRMLWSTPHILSLLSPATVAERVGKSPRLGVPVLGSLGFFGGSILRVSCRMGSDVGECM